MPERLAANTMGGVAANEISADGAMAIGEGMIKCPSLEYLGLSGESEEKKWEGVVGADPESTLDNEIGPIGAKGIGEGMAHCPSLRDVVLNGE